MTRDRVSRMLERFAAEWTPLRVNIVLQNKKIGRFADSI